MGHARQGRDDASSASRYTINDMGALLIRLLALLGLFWTGKQVVHQVAATLRPKRPAENRAADDMESSEMVKDPVCQTYIPKASAIQKNIRGETYYFCGTECAERFGQP